MALLSIQGSFYDHIRHVTTAYLWINFKADCCVLFMGGPRTPVFFANCEYGSSAEYAQLNIFMAYTLYTLVFMCAVKKKRSLNTT